MRTSTRFALMLAAVVTAMAWTPVPPAAAQNKRAEAEKFFRAGEQAYKAGQFAVAAQAFEESYRLMPVPAIVFSTAQAYRLQYFIDKKPERLKRAIDLYRSYIEQVRKGGRRDDAVASLAELEPILLRIEAETQTPIETRPVVQSATQLMISTQVSGAQASIDDAKGEVPLIREVSPGAHKITVTAEGYFPVEQTATAVAGKLIPIEVTLKPMPAKLRLRTEGGAHVAIDGRSAGSAPFSRPIELTDGRHFVSVTRRGRRAWSKEVSVKRGQELTVKAPLATTTQRKLSYWVFGASGLVFVSAGVTGFMALGAEGDAQEINDKRLSEGLTPAELSEYHDLRQRRDDRLGTTYLLLGVGGAVAVTGALMWLFDNPGAVAPPARVEPSESPTKDATSVDKGVVVAPVIGAESAGLALSGWF